MFTFKVHTFRGQHTNYRAQKTQKQKYQRPIIQTLCFSPHLHSMIIQKIAAKALQKLQCYELSESSLLQMRVLRNLGVSNNLSILSMSVTPLYCYLYQTQEEKKKRKSSLCKKRTSMPVIGTVVL